MRDQHELFEPSTYIDYQGPGFFSILCKPSRQTRQQSYETIILPQILTLLNPSVDTWITQAIFNQPNRRAVNVSSVGLCFADLDTYNCKGLIGKKPEEQAALLDIFCGMEGIPAPSLTLFSGRGLQAKWLLTEALGRSSLPAWNEVQNGLVRMLENFGADSNAKDVSRVLRLVQTVNTKTGEVVRIVHLSGMENCPARYEFEDLQEAVWEHYPQEKKYQARVLQFPDRVSSNIYKKLNWHRLCDIQKLVQIRDGIEEGLREITLFWELNFLMMADPVRDIWKEAQALAAGIGSEWFTQEVSKSTFSTLYRKAQEMKAGAMVEYRGRKYPAGYTPRNQSLIDRLQILPEEEREMKTIISQGEKYRRKVEKRRAAGVLPREEYLTDSLTEGRTKPWEAEGICRAWWYELKNRSES